MSPYFLLIVVFLALGRVLENIVSLCYSLEVVFIDTVIDVRMVKFRKFQVSDF